MVELVYDTIREPMRIVDIPVPVAKLLAAPRERFFKRVGHCIAYCHCTLQPGESFFGQGIRLC